MKTIYLKRHEGTIDDVVQSDIQYDEEPTERDLHVGITVRSAGVRVAPDLVLKRVMDRLCGIVWLNNEQVISTESYAVYDLEGPDYLAVEVCVLGDNGDA